MQNGNSGTLEVAEIKPGEPAKCMMHDAECKMQMKQVATEEEVATELPDIEVEAEAAATTDVSPANTREPGLIFVSAIERQGGEPADAASSPRPRPRDEDVASTPSPTLERIVEALLFAATAPVPESRLREIAGCAPGELTATIDRLNEEYGAGGRSFRIHRIAQGFQLYTLPEYSEWVGKLFKTQRVQRLSRAGLETLAIIAYKQPVTKPEIEQFRGVDSTAPLITLLDRKLVILTGRAHKPGNPFLYRTSKEFLRYFGLASLDDLPRHEELEEFLHRRDPGDDTAELPLEEATVPPEAAEEVKAEVEVEKAPELIST